MAKLSKPFQGHVLQLIEFPGSKPHSPSEGRGSLSTSNRRTSNMSQALFQVLSAFAVDMNFLLTSADTGLTEGHFFYLPLEGTFIPSLISHVGTQWFALLHRDSSWHCRIAALSLWTFMQAAPLWQKGKQISPWRLQLFLKRTQGTDLFHILCHFWVPTFRAIYTGMIPQHDKTLILSKVSELGYPKPSRTFRNICLHSTELIEPAQPEDFRLKKRSLKKPGPESPAQQTKLNQTKKNPTQTPQNKNKTLIQIKGSLSNAG